MSNHIFGLGTLSIGEKELEEIRKVLEDHFKEVLKNKMHKLDDEDKRDEILKICKGLQEKVGNAKNTSLKTYYDKGISYTLMYLFCCWSSGL